MFTKNLALAVSGFSLFRLAASDCPTVLLGSPVALEQGQSIVKDGLVLTQQFDGKLELYMQAEDGGLECLIWESSPEVQDCGAYDPKTRFSSKLQLDANIVTREFDENDANTVFWATGFNCEDEVCDGVQAYFIANCDGSVGIYSCSDPASCFPPLWSDNLKNNCIAPPPACRRTEVLLQSQRVLSPPDGQAVEKDGIYLVQKRNGVFQVWEKEANELIWEACPTTAQTVMSSKYTELQTDSNLVIRDDSKSPAEKIWASDSEDVPNRDGPWVLTLECNAGDDAQIRFEEITITNGVRTVWEDSSLYPSTPCVPLIPEPTPTCPTATVLLSGEQQLRVDDGEFVSQGGYTLAQDTNGNFQVWRGDLGSIQCVLWETETSKDPAVDSYTVMQTDGNLVTYYDPGNDAGSFVVGWASGSEENAINSDYHLVVDDCGTVEKLAIYREDPRAVSNLTPLWTADLVDCSNAPSMTPSVASSNPTRGKGKRSGSPVSDGARRMRRGKFE